MIVKYIYKPKAREVKIRQITATVRPEELEDGIYGLGSDEKVYRWQGGQPYSALDESMGAGWYLSSAPERKDFPDKPVLPGATNAER